MNMQVTRRVLAAQASSERPDGTVLLGSVEIVWPVDLKAPT